MTCANNERAICFATCLFLFAVDAGPLVRKLLHFPTPLAEALRVDQPGTVTNPKAGKSTGSDELVGPIIADV